MQVTTMIKGVLGMLVKDKIDKKIATAASSLDSIRGTVESRDMIRIKAQSAADITRREINNKPFYLSKKWLAALAAVLVPVLNKAMGLDLQLDEVVTVMVPCIAYVIGQGFADFGKNS